VTLASHGVYKRLVLRRITGFAEEAIHYNERAAILGQLVQ
jgi:hypothetical protein